MLRIGPLCIGPFFHIAQPYHSQRGLNSEKKQNIMSSEIIDKLVLSKSRIETRTSTSTQRAFTCFSSLPPELRLQIWREACFIPRYVDLWSMYQRNYSIGRNSYQCCRYESATPCPGVLQANEESRSVASKYYECAFGTVHEMQHGFFVSTEARIWVNWAVDWIVPMEERKWTGEMLESLFLENERIQRVAVAIGDVGEGLLFHDLAKMPLKEVVLYRQDPGLELGKRGLEQLRLSSSRGEFDIKFLGAEKCKAGTPERHWYDQLREAKGCVEDRYKAYIGDEEKKALVPTMPKVYRMKMVVKGGGNNETRYVAL